MCNLQRRKKDFRGVVTLDVRYFNHMYSPLMFAICLPVAKKNILKSNSFDAMQTLFFAFTSKFGLVLHVEKVVICINKTNWHPLLQSDLYCL